MQWKILPKGLNNDQKNSATAEFFALLYFDILLENSEIVRELDLYKNKRDEMIAKTNEYKKRKAIYFENIQQIDERIQKRSIGIRKVFARKKIEIEKEERRNLYRIFNELCNVINENKDSLEGIVSHIDILTKEKKAKEEQARLEREKQAEAEKARKEQDTHTPRNSGNTGKKGTNGADISDI